MVAFCDALAAGGTADDRGRRLLAGAGAGDEKHSRKRKQEDDYENGVPDEDEEGAGMEDVTPPPKKPKKASKNGRELTDAELARKLSSELNNSRSTRTGSKARGGTGTKKGGRSKKSAATVDSEDDSDDGSKKKKKSSSGAKGGFAKEFALSPPLAALLQIEKLSRPQVVKQLWVYIKGNDLQNPQNKREIMCDHNLRAVFGVDKIDMFRMNKVLGSHLHEIE
ncbi:hypothetical protein NLJ89_g2165 [Agrocybe chaxingu]|uniref:DM2 domain-containing protein n=1 Tax=Agrocybe chaxingu TaxID=84603 RepID=A0A9W8K7E1_9AGAR|nr:hypothetical protein NLJ89_g2165 [Agrocybe chaxingu]